MLRKPTRRQWRSAPLPRWVKARFHFFRSPQRDGDKWREAEVQGRALSIARRVAASNKELLERLANDNH